MASFIARAYNNSNSRPAAQESGSSTVNPADAGIRSNVHAVQPAQHRLIERVKARAGFNTQTLAGKQHFAYTARTRDSDAHRSPVTIVHQQSRTPQGIQQHQTPSPYTTPRASFPVTSPNASGLDFPFVDLTDPVQNGIALQPPSNGNVQTAAPGAIGTVSRHNARPSRPSHVPVSRPRPTLARRPLPANRLACHRKPVVVKHGSMNSSSTDIYSGYPGVRSPYSRESESKLQTPEIHPHAHDTKRSSKSFIFVPEHPFESQPGFPERRRRIYNDEYSRQQKVVRRERAEKLKEIGGSCVWCVQMKKACDIETVCDPCVKKGLPCLRAPEQIWLYRNITNNRSETDNTSRPLALPQAKRRTFDQADQLLQRLRLKVTDRELVGQAVLELRWRYPNDSWPIALDCDLLKRSAGGHTLHREQIDPFLDAARKLIPIPLLGLDSNKRDSILVFTALKMSRLSGFLVSVARSELFGRPGDYAAARLGLAYFLTSVVKILCELSEKFTAELLRKLRQKVTNAAPLKDIYIAIGLYYRVLLGLNDFKPGSMIVEILSDMTSQLKSITQLIGQLIRTDYFAQKRSHMSFGAVSKGIRYEQFKGKLPEKEKFEEEQFWKEFNELVPPIPALDHCQLAFYIFDGNAAIPTAMARNYYPFGTHSLMKVSQLLSAEAEQPSWIPLLGLPVPGPLNIEFPPPHLKEPRNDTSSPRSQSYDPDVAHLTPFMDSMSLHDMDLDMIPDELLLDDLVPDPTTASDIRTEHPSLRTSDQQTLVVTESDDNAPTVVDSVGMWSMPGLSSYREILMDENIPFEPMSSFFDFDKFDRDQDEGRVRIKRGKSLVSSNGSESPPTAKRVMCGHLAQSNIASLI